MIAFGTFIASMLANRWVQYILGGLVAAALGTYLWFAFVDWVSEERVQEAIAETTAKFEPIIKDLETRLTVANGEITAIKATFAEELKRQKDNANAKTKLYTAAIAANKTLQAKYDGLFLTNRELDDGLRAVKANTGSSATGASNSDYITRLGIAHNQCERSLADQHRSTAQALGWASEALIAARALTN
jgi:hypothetical protein